MQNPSEEKKVSVNTHKRYQAWLSQADFDMQAAELSFRNGFFEWTTFQVQQAVEKGLKALIVYSGARPPKVHKLQVLIGIGNRVCPEFRDTKLSFRFIESFTFISRYPFLLPGENKAPHDLISEEDAQKVLDQGTDMMSKIHAIIKKKAHTDDYKLEYNEKFSEIQINARIESIIQELNTGFDIEKIILFGRYARHKEVSVLSTMDILIIANTDLPFVARIKKARSLTKGGFPIIEPLIYTPHEFKIMTEEVGESFFENAIAEGKVIYEKGVSN